MRLHGFTILELIVAMILGSIISMFCYNALYRMTVAYSRHELAQEKLESLQRFYTILFHDFYFRSLTYADRDSLMFQSGVDAITYATLNGKSIMRRYRNMAIDTMSFDSLALKVVRDSVNIAVSLCMFEANGKTVWQFSRRETALEYFNRVNGQ